MNYNLKNKHLKAAICFFLLFQVINLGFSQSINFETSSESRVQITGTSSLHDWQMYAPITDCSFGIKSSFTDTSLELVDVEFQLAVDHLKSEHKKMDAIARKALKAKNFPTIRFQSDILQSIFLNDTNNTSPVIGVLEIAGVEKEIELNVIAEEDNGSDLQFQFSVPINMEDYGVKPPSFMFGAVTTGSEIVVSFELYFNKLIQ